MQPSQGSYYNNRSYYDRERDDHDLDYEVDTHNRFFSLRDREGPINHDPEDYDSRDHEPFRPPRDNLIDQMIKIMSNIIGVFPDPTKG